MIRKWGGAFLVFVLMMGACRKGVGDVREALANRTPSEFPCTQFVSRPPAGVWARLVGARGALRNAAIRTHNGVADRLYIPLSCDGSESGRVHVVMSTEDQSLLAAVSAKQDM